MHHLFQFLKSLIIFTTCIAGANYLQAQSFYSWDSFDGAADSFTVLPRQCGIGVSNWKRGPGVAASGGFTSVQFISHGFGSDGYEAAADNGDYLFFSIKTDAFTTVSISNMLFKMGKSPGADTADVVLDYGRASTGFIFERIDSFRVDTTLSSGFPYSRSLSPLIIIDPSDSLVFRLVIKNDLGSDLSTLRVCGGTGFTATTTEALSTGSMTSDDSIHTCYSGSDIPVTLDFTGPSGGDAFYRQGTTAYSMALDASGAGSVVFYANPSNTPVVFILDSIMTGCHTSALDDTSVIITSDTISREHLSDTICQGDSYTFGAIILTAAGTYNDTFSTSGCDSIVTLDLVVNPYVTYLLRDTICSGDGYTFGASTLTTSGTYIDTFSTTGCDSVVTLNLTVNPYIRHSLSDTICSGDSYTFGTSTLTTSGTYIDTFSTTGCDSIVTLNLTVNPYIRHSLSDTICSGDSYTFGTSTLTTAGIYIDTFVTTGCDSVVTLNLTVNPYITNYLSDTICAGNSYAFGTSTLTISGTYIDTFTTAGCDSIVTLNLTVNPYITNYLSDTVCSGESYTFGTSTLTTAGTYIDTFSTAGCDSIVILDFVVNPYITNYLSDTICVGSNYVFGTATLTTTGTYADTFVTTGCDSIVTLNLTVNPYITYSINDTICSGESYTFGTSTLTTAGTYVDTFSTAGCDSIVTLNLTVNPYITNSLNDTICAGESYIFGINTLTMTGTYVDTFATAGCDSIAALNLVVLPDIFNIADMVLCFGEQLTWGSMVLTMSGTYTQVFTTTNGCDSTVDLQLLIKPEASRINETEEGCGTVVFEGNSYDTSTVLVEQYKDIDGCDSVIRTINIVVNQNINDTLIKVICKGESYLFNEASYGQEGIYSDTYTADNGCDSTITLLLTVRPLPIVSVKQITHEEIICVNDTVRLVGTGAMVYSWYNDLGEIVGNDHKVAILMPRHKNYILVRGTDTNGCSDTASMLINAESCCELLMPDVFSPNGDGLNDKFGPVTYGNPAEYQFQIFDRWGRRVFVSFKADDKWDGTIGGKPAPIATYFYKLNGKCVSGELIDKKGDCTLVR